jgi:peptidoglycan hydrolase-like protein with peptidoglycan-binding domain
MITRAPIAAVLALAAAPVANAACPVHLSDADGAAPLRVVFRAACSSTSYRWNFGDGKSAVGRSVVHTYGGGRFRPTLTTSSSHVRLAPVTSVSLEVVAPRKADYGEAVILHATVEPKLPVRLGGRVFRRGSLRLTVTRPFLTFVAGPAVVRRTIAVRPSLDVELKGRETIGSDLRVVAVLRPAHAGSLRVTVNGRPTDRVDTGNAETAHIVALSAPKPGWSAVSRVLRLRIRAPILTLGAAGPSVAALADRLHELDYALPRVGEVFGPELQQAVFAFQGVNGLDRTGVVTPSLWTRLARASLPHARYSGSHVEVDKTRQVLFLVRDGKVVLISHVSTGATGNTPPGLWHVYSKVAGWSWVLWYPSYFLRGFAIHGYPDVPPYPASHGCVRIPMWLAPRIFPEIPINSAVYVY